MWRRRKEGFLRKQKFRCPEGGREGNSISIGPIAGNDRIDVGRDSSSRRQRVVPRAQLPLCTQACIHTNTDVACMLRVPRGYRERIIFTHTPRKTLDNRDASTSLWGWTWTRRVWRDFYSIEKVSPASLDYYIYSDSLLSWWFIRGVHTWISCGGGEEIFFLLVWRMTMIFQVEE